MRTPDAILADIEEQVGLRNVIDEIWEIIRDVQSSYRLALESVDVSNHLDGIPLSVIREIETAVNDYLGNHYGD